MSTTLDFKLVDAFARTPFAGNVAGVILKADDLGDRQMQAIASEFNASETTFILQPTTRDAAVRFRWFTPGREVNFCGHATLGGVHALFESGRFAHALAEPGTILPIETRSGILTVRAERPADPADNLTIWLDMPHCGARREPVNIPILAKHLRLDPSMVDPAIPPIRTHDHDILIAVRNLQTLLELQPAMSDLARYCQKERLRGVLVTTTNTLTPATVVQSRFFAPAFGVDEDPVTGSAHGPLGLHLVRSGIVGLVGGRADFFCAQAKAGGRAGVVRVVVTNSAEEWRVRIGGTCVTTASGTIIRPPD